jgi:hypothetical protein
MMADDWCRRHCETYIGNQTIRSPPNKKDNTHHNQERCANSPAIRFNPSSPFHFISWHQRFVSFCHGCCCVDQQCHGNYVLGRTELYLEVWCANNAEKDTCISRTALFISGDHFEGSAYILDRELNSCILFVYTFVVILVASLSLTR